MATRDPKPTRPPPGRDRLPAARPDHQLPPAGTGAPSPRSVGDLLRDLADDTKRLVRQEIELAKMEVGRTAKRFAIDGVWIAAGAALVAVGGLCLVIALALLLGALLDSYWLGTAITGGALVLVGALLAWKGARDIGKTSPAPRTTMASLREDADWAKREMREFKEELTKEPNR